MSRLNFYSFSLCSCVAIASCQSVQEPIPKVTQPVTVKSKTEQPKIDEGLKAINIAIEQVKNNDYESAQNILEVFLAKQDDQRVQINLALIYMRTNQVEKAKHLLNTVQTIDNTNATVLEHLAIIARQEGKFKKAKALYIDALDNSDTPSIHLNYAILLDLYLNELEPALKHYEIYQSADLSKQDGIELGKWIADLKVRIERSKK